MDRVTYDDYKTYAIVENMLYALAHDFIDFVKNNTPEGYCFFDIRNPSVRDARAYNLEKIQIILENIFCTTQQQMIVVDAKEFVEDVRQCAKMWIEAERKEADRRKDYDKQKEKDLAEYERIKKKYNL